MIMLPQEELASQLSDSLENEHLPLTAAQQTELDRRLDLLGQDRSQNIAWTDLKSELERHCS